MQLHNVKRKTKTMQRHYAKEHALVIDKNVFLTIVDVSALAIASHQGTAMDYISIHVLDHAYASLAKMMQVVV